MYLEDRIRALEERIVSLENHAEPRDDRELLERLDSIEGTCHDLINTDDALRNRDNEFDRRLAAFQRQLEEMLEQIAELDGRKEPPDIAPLEGRIRNIEQELQSTRGLRDDLTNRISELDRHVNKNRTRIEELDALGRSIHERLAKLDLAPISTRISSLESALEPLRSMSHQVETLSSDVRRRIEEILARLDKADQSHRELDARHATIERESLPNRVRDLEQGTAHRFDSIDQDATGLRKEVAWLRDRPQGNRLDNMARLVGITALAASILAIVILFWPYHTIKAQRFLVIDSNDRPMATFTSSDSGGTLDLQDELGRRRVQLAAGQDGSKIALFDTSGVERARVATDATLGAGLAVFDVGGRQNLWCGATAFPSLDLIDEQGNVRGSFSLENSSPELALFEGNRQPRVRMVTGKSENGLRVYDNAGRMRVGVGMSQDGAAVNLFDIAQRRRVVLSTNQDAAALSFLGNKEIQRTTLGMTKDDESILNLHDDAGKQRILLFASGNDAGMQVLDRDTNVLFSGP